MGTGFYSSEILQKPEVREDQLISFLTAYDDPHFWRLTVKLGSFNNDDRDGYENVKTAIRLLNETSSLHVHHAFLYISLLLLQDYDVKMPNFTFYGGHKQATEKFSFSF